MRRSYFPPAQAEMMLWASNFNMVVQDVLAGSIVPAAMAADLAARYSELASAFQLATTPETRTSPRIEAKNDAFASFKKTAARVVGTIQAAPGTTNEQRVMLGITVRKTHPTPVGRPTVSPTIEVKSVRGRVLTLRLKDPATASYRKPAGVSSAAIYTFVGTEPPSAITAWRYMGGSSKTTVVVDFGVDVPGGSQVWVTACWLNNKEESGPGATPLSAHLGVGEVSMAA